MFYLNLSIYFSVLLQKVMGVHFVPWSYLSQGLLYHTPTRMSVHVYKLLLKRCSRQHEFIATTYFTSVLPL